MPLYVFVLERSYKNDFMMSLPWNNKSILLTLCFIVLKFSAEMLWFTSGLCITAPFAIYVVLDKDLESISFTA